jgi:phosphoglycolate phosphatase
LERSRLTCLLFDLDGVLVDSRAPITRCLNLALGDLGLEAEAEARLAGFIGVALLEVFETLLAERGLDPALGPGLVEAYRGHYRHVSIAQARTFAGIPEALARLGRDRPLLVASSKPAEFSRPILEALGLLDAFAHVLGAPLEGTHREDKTRTVARALEAAGLAAPCTGAPRAAMVGDRRFDVVGGLRNGLVAVGVTWGIGDEAELREAGAHHVVHAPGELVDLLG